MEAVRVFVRFFVPWRGGGDSAVIGYLQIVDISGVYRIFFIQAKLSEKLI